MDQSLLVISYNSLVQSIMTAANDTSRLLAVTRIAPASVHYDW